MWQGADKIRHSDDKLDWRAHSGINVGPDLDFAQIMNAIGQGVLITGEGWRIEYVNPAFARMVGRPLADTIGKTMDDFIIPEDLQLLIQQRSKRLSGETTTYDFRLRRSNGEIVCVHATGVPRRLGDKVIGSISVITDLIERKKAEKVLIASEEKFHKAFISCPNIIGISTSSDGRYIDINKNFEKILGWSRDEVIGRTSKELCIFQDYSKRKEMVGLIKLNGSISDYEVNLRTKSGEIRIGEASAEIVDVGGQECLLVHVKDITERKHAEEELRQSRDELEQRVKERTEELARKNVEMERFIYTVSHDLRSPLIGVSGYLGFIEQDAQMGDLNRLKTDLRIVSDALTKMDELLMDTLELSRIGRVINPPEDVSFRDIVGDL